MRYFTIVLLFLAPLVALGARVKHVPVKGDEIIVVKTAFGVATIIQVPDKPNSVVVGDQESFKIEYLDQAVTIKPLRAGAKSNLYVYTDWKRFNVQLVNGGEAEADYVVYLENVAGPESGLPKNRMIASSLHWTPTRKYLIQDNLRLEVKRLGRVEKGPDDGLVVVDFTITVSKSAFIKPEWIWFTQDQKTCPIDKLFLSQLDLKPGDLMHGLIQVKLSEIDTTKPLRVELRNQKTSFLTLPKVESWK